MSRRRRRRRAMYRNRKSSRNTHTRQPPRTLRRLSVLIYVDGRCLRGGRLCGSAGFMRLSVAATGRGYWTAGGSMSPGPHRGRRAKRRATARPPTCVSYALCPVCAREREPNTTPIYAFYSRRRRRWRLLRAALLFTSLPIRTVPHARRHDMRARSLPCSGHRGIETLMYM
ncbi:Uncharacterized protein FWK35_00009839 [Aphis craccivora]|uniref:Uncharacterized protein n=1 Tax=Aphis craccivora TaxID=307492 RepID=A0A6G0YUK4_APHCR|nr:Uncharacterized protein FWK35_00009839 [Aphis craccivora]